MEKLSNRLDVFDHFYYEGVHFDSVELAEDGLQQPASDEALLYYLKNGGVRLACADLEEKILIEPGSILAFRLGQTHSLQALKGKVQLFCGHIPLDKLSPLSTRPGLLIFHPQGDRDIHRRLTTLLTLVEEECKAVDPSEALIRRFAESISIEIARFSSRDHAELDHLAANMDPRINRAIQAIHTDPTRRWKIEELAQIACMSRSVFAQHFHAQIGLPVQRYRQSINMSNAAMLLRNTNLPLIQIAGLTGFSTDAALIKAFRKSFSCTPRQYRCKAKQ